MKHLAFHLQPIKPMRNCSLRFLFLLLPMLFVGCVSVDERMTAYLGMHYSKVVAVWGVPQTEVDDGEGGKLMVWRFESTYTTPATVRTTTTHHSNSHGHVHGNSHTHAQHAATQHVVHGQTHNSNSHYHGNSQVNTHGNQVSTTTFTPETTTTNTYTRSFYTDTDGYIYDFAWKGWHPSY
jgi:hypothetical protein